MESTKALYDFFGAFFSIKLQNVFLISWTSTKCKNQPPGMDYRSLIRQAEKITNIFLINEKTLKINKPKNIYMSKNVKKYLNLNWYFFNQNVNFFVRFNQI